MSSINDREGEKNACTTKTLFSKEQSTVCYEIDSFDQIAAENAVTGLDSFSSLQINDVSAHNNNIRPNVVSKENESLESSTVLETPIPEQDIGLKSIEESDVIPQTRSVSEPVLQFETTSVLEKCKNFVSVESLNPNSEKKSISYFDKITTSDMFFEFDTVNKSNLYSVATPTFETIASLEQDVLKGSVELESDTVIEIIANSDTLSKLCCEKNTNFESTQDAESLGPFETVAASEQRITLSPNSNVKYTDEQNLIAVLEVSAASESICQQRQLNISFSSETINKFHPNFSAADSNFCKIFDVSKFNNLSITTTGDIIDVCGIQESGEECHEIHQIFSLPEFVDDEKLTACILENYMLVLEAPVKEN